MSAAINAEGLWKVLMDNHPGDDKTRLPKKCIGMVLGIYLFKRVV